MRAFSRFWILSAACVGALLLLLGSPVDGAATADEQIRAPRGPKDVPVPEEYPTNGRRALSYQIMLYLLSVPLISLEVFTIYDPEEAYLLFRRGLKYATDVQLTDLYLTLTRYGALLCLILYSALLIAVGETTVLLAAYGTVFLLWVLLARATPA